MIKLIALLVACMHWFNPIVWVALRLSHGDMERSCDEKVIQLETKDIRKEYAKALLSFTTENINRANTTMVAFGESNTKARIKGILTYKKPHLGVKLLSIFIFIAVTFLVATDASSQIEQINLNGLKQQRQEDWIELEDISKHVTQVAIVSQDKKMV